MSTDEIERLRKEVETVREELFQVAKLAEMGKMVAVVAHELSQPLLGIKAFAQMLYKRFSGDESIGPKVRMIEEQAIHMEGIIDSLRQYARSANIGRKSVDLLAPLRSTLDLFSERAKTLRVEIELDVPDGPLEVRGARGHLQQVVVNLVGNALDELEDKRQGHVKVGVQTDREWVLLRIADSGDGIDSSARDKLFEPFFTTKGEEKGTGLGLSICRDILHKHGGEIELMEPAQVEKVFGPGMGAGFEVRLERAKADD